MDTHPHNGKSPLISVVMPVRNNPQYVQPAIESILNQSFEDFELIIIDDASGSETKEVLNGIKDPRIVRVDNNSHSGNYKSRNSGIDRARGRYIAVMDSDDISLPERLETQYRFMEKNREYIATGTAIWLLHDSDTPRLFQRVQEAGAIKVFLLKNNVCTHPSLMIRGDVFKSYNIRYNEDYYYASDYDLMVTMSRIGKITNLPEPLLQYRIHKKQISSAKMFEQIMYADYIRLKQLHTLNLKPSTDEMMVHLSLMKRLPVLESKFALAEKWCNKILKKNSTLKIYNNEIIFSFLKDCVKEMLSHTTDL